MASLNETYNVQYINLYERLDRRNKLETLFLNSTLFSLHRFDAILNKQNGAVGCTISHLKLLKNAIDNNDDYLIVIEDDFMVDDFRLFETTFKNIMRDKTDFDVLLFGGNILPPYLHNTMHTIQVTHSQTTVGYMVKKSYFNTLYNNIKLGLYYLLKMPHEKVKYAIDKFWIILQKRDKWLMIYPLMVYQSADYSNIENKHVDYKKLMLDANKNYLFNIKK